MRAILCLGKLTHLLDTHEPRLAKIQLFPTCLWNSVRSFFFLKFRSFIFNALLLQNSIKVTKEIGDKKSALLCNRMYTFWA